MLVLYGAAQKCIAFIYCILHGTILQIGCKVRGFFNRTADIRGPWLQSTTTYWAGIRVSVKDVLRLNMYSVKAAGCWQT